MNETAIQLAGYAASVLLAISLLVTNDLKFRWLNSFGCLAFIIYGIMIHALPIVLTNSILLLINSFHLVRIYRHNENFDLVEFNSGDKMISKFLDFYKADIGSYFPEYAEDDPTDNIRFVVLRDMVIANIFVAVKLEDGTALVKLNYTTPKYRDYKIGKFLFHKEKQLLLSRGINRLVYTHIMNKNHEEYLVKMGFLKELVGEKVYYFKNIL